MIETKIRFPVRILDHPVLFHAVGPLSQYGVGLTAIGNRHSEADAAYARTLDSIVRPESPGLQATAS